MPRGKSCETGSFVVSEMAIFRQLQGIESSESQVELPIWAFLGHCGVMEILQQLDLRMLDTVPVRTYVVDREDRFQVHLFIQDR
jgi:hypothetical protein